MSQAQAVQDPFGASSGASSYVPRRATEEALERLVRIVLEEGRAAMIQGPGGIGKTVLLHRLAEVAGERFRPLYMPFAALSPDELGHWVLSALGLEGGGDPRAAIQGYMAELLEDSGTPLLLLVDDATALPIETARWLAEFLRASSGGLRLALAALETPASSGLVVALGPDLEVVPLISPMSREETRAYLAARLARSAAPKARRATVDDTFERLHLVARGNPRRLHFAADALLRGEDPESIDAVLGAEQPARPARRSSLSALIRPSAPNRAGTFRFAHEELRPRPEPVPAPPEAAEPEPEEEATTTQAAEPEAAETVASAEAEPAIESEAVGETVEAAASEEPAAEEPAAAAPVEELAAEETAEPAPVEEPPAEESAPAEEPAEEEAVAAAPVEEPTEEETAEASASEEPAAEEEAEAAAGEEAAPAEPEATAEPVPVASTVAAPPETEITPEELGDAHTRQEAAAAEAEQASPEPRQASPEPQPEPEETLLVAEASEAPSEPEAAEEAGASAEAATAPEADGPEADKAPEADVPEAEAAPASEDPETETAEAAPASGEPEETAPEETGEAAPEESPDETPEVPWSTPPVPEGPPWYVTAGHAALGAIRVTASRARVTASRAHQATQAWREARRARAAEPTAYLGNIRVREAREPIQWRRGAERLLTTFVAMALLGLAIVYLAPPLADASRGFLTRGVALVGDGFTWVAHAVENDFSSAREVATGDFESASEMAKERLSSAAEALLRVPERLLTPSDPDTASSSFGNGPSLERPAARPSRSRPQKQSRAQAPARTSPGSSSAEPAPAATSSLWPNVVRVGINASPWARISVDGFPIGETPIAGFPLLAGTYTFKATFPDGSAVVREIQITPETRSLVFP